MAAAKSVNGNSEKRCNIEIAILESENNEMGKVSIKNGKKVMQHGRILHIVHQYHPDHTGGTELYTRQLATCQAALGHDVHVITPAAIGSCVVEEAVTVHRVAVGRPSRATTLINSIHQPQLQFALGEILHRFDIVHIQHLMGWPLEIVSAIRALGIPYVVTLHDYWYPCVNAQLLTNTDQTVCAGPDARWHNCGRCVLARGGLGDRQTAAHAVAPLMAARAKRLRPILAHAAAVIAPTHFVQTIYSETGFDRANFVVIPHGITLPDLVPAPPRNDTQLHVLYVGSIAEQKGIHVLIEAFNQLPHGRFQLTIAGSLDTFPAYAARLQSLITHPGIRLVGRISHDDVWQQLSAADLFVMPTLWYEASPLTIDETFAAGTPIIASRIGAATEKIRHGVDGYLFPPGDAAALATLLRRIGDDPAVLAHLRANIQPVNSIDQHVAAIDQLYAQLYA